MSKSTLETRGDTRRRRRRFRRRPRSWKQGYYRLNRSVRKLVKQTYPESKETNPNVSSNAVTTAGTFIALTSLGQGASEIDERVGDRIIIKKVSGRLYLEEGGASATARIIMFWDKNPNGTTPAVLDLLRVSDTLSSLNTTNGQRFKVIYDNLVSLTNQDPQWVDKFYRNMRGNKRRTQYIGTIANVTNNIQHHIWIFFIGNNAINPPNISFQVRIRYIDN